MKIDCGYCLQGIARICARKPTEESREEFEHIVAFLASVPLFKSRLPPAELPKVARLLKRTTWTRPGQRLIREGDTGRAFFLIESGEVAVITCSDGPNRRIRAILQAGDYFGGHTLTQERQNIATIEVYGKEPLVTLSMSRSEFKSSGLCKVLRFPKRPAIYDAHSDRFLPSSQTILTEKELNYIVEAIQRNANLRALVEPDTQKLWELAAIAEKRSVPKGSDLVKAGDVCQEFFIVKSGSFLATLQERPASPESAQLSAETAVTHSRMAERVLRKEEFLRSLSTPMKLNIAHLLTEDGGSRSSSSGVHLERASSFSCGNSNPPRPPRRSWSLRIESSVAELKSVPAAVSSLFHRSQAKQPRQGGHSLLHLLRRDNDSDNSEEMQPQRKPTSFPFSAGESFGELSLLYNSRWWATFTAQDDAEVFVLSRRHFHRTFGRSGCQARFKEYVELLDEVQLLVPCLSSERWELACNAGGLVEFSPGERILREGKIREARQWYIIFAGSAILKQRRLNPETGRVEDVSLGVMGRSIHFGERSLLRGDAASQVSVDAGPEGCVCLTFDFEVTRVLLEKMIANAEAEAAEDGKTQPSVYWDIDKWCEAKTQFRRDPNGVRSAMERNRERGMNKAIKLKDLTRVNPLGSGAYGEVFLVEHGDEGNRYALKAVSKSRVLKNHAQRHVAWERELLMMVESPFIIKLHRTFRDKQSVYFLLEAALGGNLLELLHDRPEVFAEDTPRGMSAAFYSAGLIAAIEHLHERNIVHRDIKPENALIDERGYPKLADLGFARFVLGKTYTLVGTPDYMAPEMMDFPHQHDSSVDWWALGVVHYELLTGQHPWEDAGLCDQMARLMAIRRSQERYRIEFPFGFPHVAHGFVKQLLGVLPNRLGAKGSAAEVRKHPMFSELEFNFDQFHAQTMPSPPKEERRPDELDEFEDDSDLGSYEGFPRGGFGPLHHAHHMPALPVPTFNSDGSGDECEGWDEKF